MPSPSPLSSLEQARQALAHRLRQLRLSTDLTARAHAKACGWHESKTSRIEHARTVPSANDIRTWCRICGTPDQAEALVTMLIALDEMYVEWRRKVRSLHDAQRSAIPLYDRTTTFRIYQPHLIPGLLQTPAYAEALLRGIAAFRDLPDHDLAEAVSARTNRQRILRRAGHRFIIVVEESALYYAPCDADSMAGQLGHLMSAATLPSVSLGIIRRDLTQRRRRPVEGFWIFDDNLVQVELVSGFLSLQQPDEIKSYAAAFEEFADLACRGATARALITTAIDTLG